MSANLKKNEDELAPSFFQVVKVAAGFMCIPPRFGDFKTIFEIASTIGDMTIVDPEFSGDPPDDPALREKAIKTMAPVLVHSETAGISSILGAFKEVCHHEYYSAVLNLEEDVDSAVLNLEEDAGRVLEMAENFETLESLSSKFSPKVNIWLGKKFGAFWKADLEAALKAVSDGSPPLVPKYF